MVRQTTTGDDSSTGTVVQQLVNAIKQLRKERRGPRKPPPKPPPEMCELMGIRKTRTTALHLLSDGLVERMNQTLESQLSISLHVDQHH